MFCEACDASGPCAGAGAGVGAMFGTGVGEGEGEFEVSDDFLDFASLSLSLSLMMRNLLPLRVDFPFPVISDVEEVMESLPLAMLLALVLRTGSVIDFERSRLAPCFLKKLGNFEGLSFWEG